MSAHGVRTKKRCVQRVPPPKSPRLPRRVCCPITGPRFMRYPIAQMPVPPTGGGAVLVLARRAMRVCDEVESGTGKKDVVPCPAFPSAFASSSAWNAPPMSAPRRSAPSACFARLWCRSRMLFFGADSGVVTAVFARTPAEDGRNGTPSLPPQLLSAGSPSPPLDSEPPPLLTPRFTAPHAATSASFHASTTDASACQRWTVGCVAADVVRTTTLFPSASRAA